MNIYKAFLIFISNITCCMLQHSNSSGTLKSVEESETIPQNVSKISVFDKCCDKGQLFDVIKKMCILDNNNANKRSKASQEILSLG